MKCVHGVDMAESCGNCWAQTAGTDMRIMPDFCVRKQPKIDDRLATELASLTQAIQGLSGNVAKLVEDRPKITGWDGIAQDLANAKPGDYRREGWPEVKRGPVTDEELKTVWNIANEMLGYAPWGYLDNVRAVIETFAKLRGLID